MAHEPETQEEREGFIVRQLQASIGDLEKFPAYVNIETNNMCNARCIMCGIDFDKRTLVRMDDALFAKIVAELSAWRHHVRKVNLYSDNEPLLDRDLARKIKVIKDAGIETIAIATNASALVNTRAEELIRAGLDQIYITIDSMIPERYERIRVGLSFEKVYANTVNFIRRRDALGGKTAVRLQMVLQESNRGEKDAFAAHWAPLLSPGDYVVVHRAHNWGGTVKTLAYDEDENINAFPCTALWTNAMIHADGKMALCSVDTEPVSPFTLGDINTQSIESVWLGETLRAMRERHLTDRRGGHPLCDGCTTWREQKQEIFLEIGRENAPPTHLDD